MSVESNKAIIRRWVDEVWNGGNLRLADELFAADYTYGDPASPPLTMRGPAAIKELVTSIRGGLPNLKITIEQMVGEGDVVAWRWTCRGTHTSVLAGVPPSGRKVEFSGVVTSRFAGGKWVRDELNWDTLGLMRQIGAIPSAA